MKTLLLTIFLFTSFDAFCVVESKLERVYNNVVAPFYHSSPLRFQSYFNDASRKFPYKYINKGNKQLLVILPGKGEPLERYAEMLYDLRTLKRDVLLVQFRGQGYSSRSLKDPEKTHIRKFNYIIDDLDHLFNHLKIRKNYSKISLVAHSMGAHHGLRYEAAYPIFDQIILNSPLIGLLDESKTDRNYYLTQMMIALGMGNSYVPGRGGWQDWSFEKNDVTQSFTRFRNIRRIHIDNSNTRLGSVTVRWANEALKSEKKLFSQAKKINTPVKIFQAGNELIVSNEKQQLLCKVLPSCEIFHVKGAMHNFVQEKDKYRNRFLDFILARL
jgi:lysophospholipase